MKTATVTKLRQHFGSLLNWVEEGEAVSISKRGKVIALLSPPPRNRRHRGPKRPDFAARLKRIYGDNSCAHGPIAIRNPQRISAGKCAKRKFFFAALFPGRPPCWQNFRTVFRNGK
ncbi:MAG: type II toxin-antitoxin system prevent-host-death family antitoxin [Verrucomicrobiota bacterium]